MYIIDIQFFYIQLLGTLAGFLSRKTDFFVGAKNNEWETVCSKQKTHLLRLWQMKKISFVFQKHTAFTRNF